MTFQLLGKPLNLGRAGLSCSRFILRGVPFGIVGGGYKSPARITDVEFLNLEEPESEWQLIEGNIWFLKSI